MLRKFLIIIIYLKLLSAKHNRQNKKNKTYDNIYGKFRQVFCLNTCAADTHVASTTVFRTSSSCMMK